MLKNSFYIAGLLISVLLLAGFSTKPLPAKSNQQPELLDTRLTGTIIGKDKAFAFIEDTATGEQGIYLSGDGLKEYRITKIIKDRVTLTKNNREIMLIMEGAAPFVKGEWEEDGPLAREETLPPSYQGGIKGVVYELAANRLANMLNNVSSYRGKVRVYQHHESGKKAGFRIHYLTDGKDFEKMGIENGDIIRKVNGLDINDASDVFKVVYKLSAENTFKVEVKRKSQKKILNYRLDERLYYLVPIISNLLKMPEDSAVY